MSDNVPFDIQMEIIKKVYDVKSLIRFRSVSKPWKSFIDSSQFINGYGSRHTQPHSLILSMGYADDRFICLVDDVNNETLKVQQQEFAPFVMSPLLKHYCLSFAVGVCHGLVCLYGVCRVCDQRMIDIWNPYIGKSFGIGIGIGTDPYNYSQITTSNSHNHEHLVFGFGICPVTRDPTVVKILQAHNKPWRVEVFTLSSGVWNVIPSSNLIRQSIRLTLSPQVVIDRFIYWAAYDTTLGDDHYYTTRNVVVSFDLITKEFKVVDLPDRLTYNRPRRVSVSVSKLRESLVVYGSVKGRGGVWVMQHDSSFKKLFSIRAPVDKILGFRESGELIFETTNEFGLFTLAVYDPCSQQLNNLGIYGTRGRFVMGSYKESLLLLDHSDLHIYCRRLHLRCRFTK